MAYQDYSSADLTQLGSTSDDAIVYNLSARWKQKSPYTRLNATTLVSVNPFEPLVPLLSDDHAELYANVCYRNTGGEGSGLSKGGNDSAADISEKHQHRQQQQIQYTSAKQQSQQNAKDMLSSLSNNGAPLPPHPFELAAKIYLHLRRTGQDQAVVFSGITGSGKSTASVQVVAQLCRLASHSKKDNKMAAQVQQAQFILDSFGCAFTRQNANSSLFSKFMELQFNEKGRVLGVKTLCYLLEHSRVTKIPQDERSFHVFYYLLHSSTLSDQDRSQLRLNSDSFAYLGQSRLMRLNGGSQHHNQQFQYHPATNFVASPPSWSMPNSQGYDAQGFEDLKAAMKLCGLKQRQVNSIWRLLAVILHLGNLQFLEPVAGNKQSVVQEAASVRNPDELEFIADILGVPSDKLLLALTYRTKLIRRDMCTVVLNAAGAAAHRDSLARTLYTALFAFIVEAINNSLCHPDPANFVAILDQQGFNEPSTTHPGFDPSHHGNQTGTPNAVMSASNFANNNTNVQIPGGGPSMAVSGNQAQPLVNVASGQTMQHFEQFSTNFASELLHGFVSRRALDDAVGLNKKQKGDGVTLIANPTGMPLDPPSLQLLVGKQYKDDQTSLSKEPTGSSSTRYNTTSTAGSSGGYGTGGAVAAAASRFGGAALQTARSTPQYGNKDNNLGSLDSVGTIFPWQGLVRLLDDTSASYSQTTTNTTVTDADFLHKATLQFRDQSAVFITNRASSNFFAIQHYSSKVDYSVDDFLEKNLDQISSDFVVLLRNSADRFIVDLFSQSAGIAIESHPKFEKTIVKAQLPTKPRRQPSRHGGAARRMSMIMAANSSTAAQALARTHQQHQVEMLSSEEHGQKVGTVLSQIYFTLKELFITMDECSLWNVVCLRPNDLGVVHAGPDTKRLRAQVKAFLLPETANKKQIEYTMSYSFKEFVTRYNAQIRKKLGFPDRTAFTPAPIDATTPTTAVESSEKDLMASAMPQSAIPVTPAEAAFDVKTDKEQCLVVAHAHEWEESKFAIGDHQVWMSEEVWQDLENRLRQAEKDERLHQKTLAANAEMEAAIAAARVTAEGLVLAGSAYSSTDQLIPKLLGQLINDGASDAGGDDGDIFSDAGGDDDLMSEYNGIAANTAGLRSRFRGNGQGNSDPEKQGGDGPQRRGTAGAGKGGDAKGASKAPEVPIEVMPTTRARKMWVFFTWAMTWWIPTFTLRICGKMKREDIRMAWREKVALCCIIFFMSFIIIFVITGFGKLMCPGADRMFSQKEVGYHGAPDDFFVSLRGKVYDITKFAKTDHSNGHSSYPSDLAFMLPFAGTDVTDYFPLPLELACYGLANSGVNMITNNTIIGAQVHGPPTSDTTIGWASTNNQGQWYWNVALKRLLPMKQGDLAFEMKDIAANADRKWFVIDGAVYDLTNYYATTRAPGNLGQLGAGVPSVHFLPKPVEDMAFNHNGEDVSAIWNKLPLDGNTKVLTKSCFDQVFYIGKVDYRNSFQCQFTNYMLLVTSIILVSVIAIKFLAALQLGSARVPEEHDKFVIVQIPCYTEDEDSLRKTIDSIAALRYDDKRKLIFIIADGMIIGSGNDLPTPRIVLDLLGADPALDPEPLAFKSIGDGSKQLNMGKIYSGLYEFEGHVVPYIVVAKVGKPSERSRPGNRGKRDSQVILMKFLNKVHFDAPMCPLELEIYHQMKNVIGVNPSFYEYILQVDADTEVMPDALNRLVSCMIHDGKIIGLCGETQLGNEENSWTTMIQVYEYYISHHLSKAFESLFGSVTCLPGCFCMYRVRTMVKNIPLIINSKVIEEYSDNSVDTLHKKNLLSLGEDRYLTTLMMKHFPQYKMTFTPDATCKTVAPDRWSVLLSQRRRWINSTIHNLAELMFLPEMCGFCCFSMRFVVFLDLFGTLTLPASVIYLVYLIVIVATGLEALPKISLILIGAVYGLQALIFIIKRQWQHIGWMFIYILAIPLFSFFIPIYSFWHFDDFSWGNTRMVVGESTAAKKVVILGDDDEPFDERMIPLKKWSVYEQEMWEVQSVHSLESKAGAGNGGGTEVSFNHQGVIASPPQSVVGGPTSSGRGGDTVVQFNAHQNPYHIPSHEDMHQEFNNSARQSQQHLHRPQISKSSFALDEDPRRASTSSLQRSVLGMNSWASPPPIPPSSQQQQSYNPYSSTLISMPPQMHSPPGSVVGGKMYQHQSRSGSVVGGGGGNSHMDNLNNGMMSPLAIMIAKNNGTMTNGNGGSVVGGGGSAVGYATQFQPHHQPSMSITGRMMPGGSVPMSPPAMVSNFPIGIMSSPPPLMIPMGAGVAGSVVGGRSGGMNANGSGSGGDQPSAEQLAHEIENILMAADLLAISKKQIRERLTAFFGVDLNPRRDEINAMIEQVLHGDNAAE